MLHRRTVGDVMTEEVLTLRPNTPFQEVAALLDANDIVAAPVVDDDGAPVGVVSAADVLRHETGMPDPQGQDGDDERAWGKARARTAGALMSSPVFTARADWTIPGHPDGLGVLPREPGRSRCQAVRTRAAMTRGRGAKDAGGMSHSEPTAPSPAEADGCSLFRTLAACACAPL